MATFRERLKPRFAVFGGIVLSVLLLLAVRLWSVQVVSGSAYAERAESNRTREIAIEAPRGRILDREGRPLAANRATLAVLVSPAAKDDDDLLDDLTTLLGVPRQEIVDRLNSVREAPLEPRVVAIDVSREAVAFIAENESALPGVEVRVIAVRDYPGGETAAHLLGYTGLISGEELSQPGFSGYRAGDLVGKTGAEKQFESVLQGDHGRRLVEVDAWGRQRGVVSESEPVPGRDIRLTVDMDVQRVAENALEDALSDARREGFSKAKAGAAVAMDIRTGEILAMASAPAYDPRQFIGGISQEDWGRLNAPGGEYPLNNRVIMAAYPPASTFKVVTGLAGLTDGITSQWRQYRCVGRWTGMGEEWSKACWQRRGHGTVSFHGGMVESCDIVFYEIGHELHRRGEERLQAVAREFNLGSRTGIDLPGEVPGRVPDAKWKAEFNRDYPEYAVWLPGDTVNMSIGQGDLLTTPLQMAVVYAAICNGGAIVTPHVLGAVLDADGRPVIESEAKAIGTLTATPAELGILKRSLFDVTEVGTGRSAFAGFGRKVFGKTGTAEVYGKDDYAWFVAVAPAEEPRYAVTVVIEQGGHGGSIAAPAARDILSQLFGLPVRHVRAHDVSR